MKKNIIVLVISVLLISIAASAQKITYSDPEREDLRNMGFDIIGKMNGNIVIYKNNRDLHSICIYDPAMKLVNKVRMTFLTDRIFKPDFIQYPDFFYMIYQFQKRNVVYCMAAKLNADGKLLSDPIQLDTTEVNLANSNKVYSFLFSEDKQKLMLFKINTKSDKVDNVSTLLFDKSLTMLHKSRIVIPMPDRNDFLANFQLDNDGDIAFLKEWGGAQNDNISKLLLMTKSAMADEIKVIDLNISGFYLDDIRLKVDNFNRHYLVTSFFAKQRRGNVDGLYLYLWDKDNQKDIFVKNVPFTDEFRTDARSGGSSLKTAFNDFFLRNIIMKKDGGFFLVAEAMYSSTRGNTLSRWDYLSGSPVWTPSDYYLYNSPFYFPGSRYGMYDVTRYFAENIAAISFDMKGKMEWSNVIAKSQYDDNSDRFLGYALVNMGDQIHFLFNMQEKRQTIFDDQSLSIDGQLLRNPTFKNLDKGYDFMPRQAKQVGARMIIVPCEYHNYVCFAKVEL